MINEKEQKKAATNFFYIGRIKVTKKAKVSHSGFRLFVMFIRWNIRNSSSALKNKSYSNSTQKEEKKAEIAQQGICLP